jgi:hypothetical protein
VETVSEDNEIIEEPEDLDDDTDEPIEGSGPEDWPEEARRAVAKLRKENRRYRLQRREEKLVQDYGSQAVSLIPDEVTDPARRAELAAKIATAIGDRHAEVPPGLAAVAAAPSAGGTPVPDTLDIEDFNKIVDEIGLTQAALQYGHRLNVAENPLRDRVVRPTQGTYKPTS